MRRVRRFDPQAGCALTAAKGGVWLPDQVETADAGPDLMAAEEQNKKRYDI